MSDYGRFSSYEGHKERRTGKICWAFSRMHRALDDWMPARARLHQLKASTTMGFSIF